VHARLDEERLERAAQVFDFGELGHAWSARRVVAGRGQEGGVVRSLKVRAEYTPAARSSDKDGSTRLFPTH
jgi:hypothetical protein